MQIIIDYDDKDIQQAFNRLVDLGQDLEPVFDDIGQYLKQTHRYSWDNEQEPDGTPWEELLPETWAKKKNPKMLRDSNDMLRDLITQSSSDALEFGLNTDYAVYHDFGTKHMPARQLLGVSAEDNEEILNIIADHIKDSLNI